MKILSSHKGKLFLSLGTGAVAILAAVLLLYSHKKAQPDIKPDDNSWIADNHADITQLTDLTLADILLQNMPHNIPISELSVHISQDGYIQLNCILLSDSFSDFFQSLGTNIPAPIKLVLTMLPDKVPASFAMRISLDSQSGKLSLTPQSLSLNEIDISPTLLPAEFEIEINRIINDFLFKPNEKIRALDLSDGKITVTLTEK